MSHNIFASTFRYRGWRESIKIAQFENQALAEISDIRRRLQDLTDYVETNYSDATSESVPASADHYYKQMEFQIRYHRTRW